MYTLTVAFSADDDDQARDALLMVSHMLPFIVDNVSTKLVSAEGEDL